jgi:pimeloyl-ACP methyl ester carboxylesterase
MTGRGADVRVPELTRVADSDHPWFEVFVDTVISAATGLEGPITVIGHSGAGVFLPGIGAKLGEGLEALVFVDAVVPPVVGLQRTPREMKELLDEMTVDGLLLPWLDWWPTETIEELLANPADRAALRSDMPRLPRPFYEEEIPMPHGWSGWPCGFVQLSGAYESEFEDAQNRGWPRTSVNGTHLSVYTDPEVVVEAVEWVLNQIRS